jgi:hypothetical protein
MGIKDNTTLLRLDYRMTGITQECESSINMSLKHNIDRFKRKQRELAGLSMNLLVLKCITSFGMYSLRITLYEKWVMYVFGVNSFYNLIFTFSRDSF